MSGHEALEEARPFAVVRGREHAATSAAGPVVVSLVEPHEVVVVGLTHMLAPYHHLLKLAGPAEQESGTWTDVVLVDPCERGVGTEHIAAVIAGASLGKKLVIYTWADSQDPEVGLARLVADGWPVRGWLSKTLPADELVEAVVRVHGGHRVILDRATGSADPFPQQSWKGPVPNVLTRREQEVVGLIVEGLTNLQIAEATFLSINSVKTYIRSCYRKMGVTRRSQAVIWGVRHGLEDAHPRTSEAVDCRATS